MKFKLILVALLLAFLLAVSASAVSAADNATLESVSDGDAIAADNSEVLSYGQLGAGADDVWIDNTVDESKIYVEGYMEVWDHKNIDPVLLIGMSGSRNTTYSDNNTTSIESQVMEKYLNTAKKATGASDIEIIKIDRYVSSEMWDHRKYETVDDNSTGRATHIASGSYAKITTVHLNVITEYNREDQKLIETKLTAKYDAASKNIIATVKDANGNPVSGLKVGFAINGVKYETTDANGEAKYSTAGLVDGTYKVTVRAYGNEIYNNSNKETVTFTIGSKEKSKIFLRNALYFVTQVKMVQVTLWDGNNQPLANKTVSIRAYDSVWHGVTDENGDAFVRVGIGFGTHDATVSFDGDDQYFGSEKAGYIRVIKQTPSVMVRGADTMFKATNPVKIVKVHLRDRYDQPLPEGSKIVLKLNGKTYIGFTDAEGVARIAININTVGTFTAQAMYGGNSAYNPVTRDVKIRIV
ncbi:MAG: Ig-like domain-containing protein [Methanobrevibacter sp.]